jgi:hypothetical protein
MAIVTDYVVALEIESEDVAGVKAPTRRWPGHRAKGILPLDLAWLHFAVTGEDPHAKTAKPRFVHNPFNDRDEWRAFEAVAELAEFDGLTEEDSPWVYEVPRKLVDELARLEHLGDVAKRWSELREASGGPKELEHTLLELRKLARLAKAERKSLLLRVAL